ncbi:hypothetical protein [Petroclostridium sp. X23]|uniref:hypothetical protein n=1 Tax=Petroclostridium sp. X23 TaxID=3045146 RepID=UPI0024AE41CC|nr:hypothetical protein [Petroclostridium sp. X23]WHH57288.1 hypothetical protein QKW49_15785 [Petroclostridium sp. X23]
MNHIKRSRVNIRMEPSLCDFFDEMSAKLNVPRNYLMIVALKNFQQTYSNVNVSGKGLVDYLDNLSRSTEEYG